MGLREYYLRIEAYQIEQAREREKIALQAWFNQAVQATVGSDEHPRPKFTKFSEFYDIDAVIDEIRNGFENEYIKTSHKSVEQRRVELIKQRRKEFLAMKARKEEKEKHE